MASQLSVAEVAALINVSIVLVQATYPLLIAAVAIGILKVRVNAATWSVFGRLINDSHWPTILGTDAGSDREVDKRVRGLALLSNLAALILAVAAAATPLGIYAKQALAKAHETTFTYAQDLSPVGRATQPRSGYQTNRLCGGLFYLNCPGNNDGWSLGILPNGTPTATIEPGYMYPYLSSAIAQNITVVFTSASSGGTVANVFDIEYRSFINYNNETNPGPGKVWIDHGRPRTIGQFHYYQQFMLDSNMHAVDGLIVSTTSSPGIGFRNHTLPPSSQFGYTWTEDILWLEPETACTDLNITLDYTIPAPNAVDAADARLTDRGGLTNLPDHLSPLDLNNTQTDPQLFARSWLGAVLTNDVLAQYLNATKANVHVGKEYFLEDIATSTFSPTPLQLAFSTFGSSINGSVNTQLPGPLAWFSVERNVSSDFDIRAWHS